MEILKASVVPFPLPSESVRLWTLSGRGAEGGGHFLTERGPITQTPQFSVASPPPPPLAPPPAVTMAKRLNLLMEGALPSPPTVAAFLQAMRNHLAKAQAQRQQQQPDPLHGAAFQAQVPQKPSGSKYTESCAAKLFVRFADFLAKEAITYPTLDDFLVACGRWHIASKHLFVHSWT